MFRPLRIRLTLLFLLAGGVLILAVAASSYGLISYYFQRSTDRALQHVMAEHMALLGESLPPELSEAEQAWYSSATGLLPPQVSAALRPLLEAQGQVDLDQLEFHESSAEQALDADLAAIFVLALSERGRLLPGFNLDASPLRPDREAVAEAAEHGYDWRTIQEDGTRIRLLTYRLDDLAEPTYLQVGRSLQDQERILGALVIGLVIVGAIGLSVLGGASWWLAGRSLAPTEQAWQRQQTFVANASHELRTPLTLIRSSAEVARRRVPTSSETAQLLDDVLRECDHMSQLIEDQLLLSRLDRGDIDLTLRPIAVEQLVSDLHRQVGRLPVAAERTILCESEDAWVLGDPTRLRQILLILLDNALENTSTGDSIRLVARRIGARVEVKVVDSGRGIPAEEVDLVHERFYRVDKARSRSDGHSGLGLAIAKSLAEAHRGRIRLESELGAGTAVTLTLPSLQRTRQDSDDSEPEETRPHP